MFFKISVSVLLKLIVFPVGGKLLRAGIVKGVDASGFDVERAKKFVPLFATTYVVESAYKGVASAVAPS